MKFTRKAVVLAAVPAAAIIAGSIGGGVAIAASSAPPPQATRGCVSNNVTRALTTVYENPASFKGCSKSQFAVTLSGAATAGPRGAAGAQGPAGPAGAKGDAGAQGPSGVVSTGTHSLVSDASPVSVPTGGSFVSRAVQVGTVHLDAGTYLVNLGAKATPPAGGTGAMQVFPQLFVYDQAANANFTGDLFNAGSGALEAGSNATINSYYSGSSEITVPAGGETLHVYAFGYDSDTSAGSYTLNDLSVTATQLNS